MRMRYNFTRGNVRRFFVTLACLIAASCETDAARPVTPGETTAQQQKAVHREFIIEHDETATRLLQRRMRTGEVAALSDHYAAAGYATLAELFSASVPPRKETAPAVRWQCPLSDVENANITKVAQHLAEIRQSGEYLQAIAEAAQAIDRQPPSCQLRVEWAAAVLIAEIANRQAVTLSDQERAVRTLVTSAAEVAMVPEGYVGRGQVLRDVSWFFKATGDRAARRGALLIARRLIIADEAGTSVPALKAAHTRLLQDVERQLSE
jgi:hypothetical protein